MTTEEYFNLPRFKKEECQLPIKYEFHENDIFEVKTLDKKIAYVKVLKNFFNSLLLLHECNQQGELITTRYEKFEATKENVLSLIEYENFWRLYKSRNAITDTQNNNSNKIILSLQPTEYFSLS